MRNVGSGVPKGAVLSPMLFSTLLHDIPWSADSHSLVYADDVSIVVTARNLETAQRLLQMKVDKLDG